ncbi:DNA primase [Thermosyntropha lipolytica DSM 11003]|uniref:DNA primase n=1 Tax=Thermosyntropha lipolytica DSM 11003 TaxID=1123382 RepID=A0A1M5RYH0_9FIRM|nr:DNA primase [Thermosyntropha lipolytica]SHH31250.1 DNA primase [Thermosyntropha lipolytica DSM 11003]
MNYYQGNNDIVEEIKLRLDIVDIVAETVDLTRKGNRYWGKCPFHQEKTPSFCVTPDKNMYYCFGCHTGGDIFSFIMKRDGVSFKEALEILAAKAGISISSPSRKRKDGDSQKVILDINKKAALFYHEILKKPEGEKALSYLKARGITEETMEIFKLGYAPDNWESLKSFMLANDMPIDYLLKSGLLRKSEKTGNYFDLFRQRIIFPIFKYNGDIVALGGRVLDDSLPKYLNSPETEIFSKRNNLYGLFQAKDAIREANEVLLVEGYVDCIKLYQAGIKNVVASLGTAFTPEQARLLARYAEKVLILYDGDEAGQKSALKAGEILHAEKLQVYVVLLPGGKDPDEYIDLVGKEDFLTFIQNNKISYIEFKIDRYIKNRNALYLEDKIKIINSIKPDISGLESEIARDYYIKILAQKLQLEENLVYRELNRTYRPKTDKIGNKTITERYNIKYGNYTWEDKLIATMLKEEAVFKRVKELTGYKIFTNQAYRKICAIYEEIEKKDEGMERLEIRLQEEGLISHYAKLAFLMQEEKVFDAAQVDAIIGRFREKKREILEDKLLNRINILKDKGDFKEVLKFLVYLDLFLNNVQEGGIR